MKLKRNIFRDDSGSLEGLPLELIIIILVMGISMPVIWNSAQYYSYQELENDMLTEIEILLEEIKEISNYEEGNIRTLDINIEDNLLSEIKYIETGGKDIEDMKSIRYRIDENTGKVSFNQYLVSNFTDGIRCSLQFPQDGGKIFIKKSGVKLHDTNIIEVGIIRE
ncbi:MAG: hypothetical protein ACOC40_00250 [Thermoplasmatota archaeon]